MDASVNIHLEYGVNPGAKSHCKLSAESSCLIDGREAGLPVCETSRSDVSLWTGRVRERRRSPAAGQLPPENPILYPDSVKPN